MAGSISKMNSEKTSTAKPSVKPLAGDKYLVIDPDILLYDIEYGYKTEEGEDTEILNIQYKSLP